MIIPWGKIVKLLKSAMIISIWMIHRFSGIMSLLLRRRLTAVIMSTFTIRRRSFLLLRKRMCINVLCRRRRKAGYLFFHWRGGYLTKEVLKELLELIRKAGDEKDKTAMVSINWPQAVIRVQYTDMQVQESVTIEEANEGEK